MILVGVDGAAPSRAAVDWSMKRAATTGEDVLLALVLDDEWGVMGSRLQDEVRREAESTLAAEAHYAASLATGVRLETALLSGNPMWELISASSNARLVAVGTHKTGFVRGRVFGSRSLQLAAAAHAPVAIVPASSSGSRHGVVVGVNESPAAVQAVRFAADEAYREDQELLLLSARPEAFSGGDTSESQDQRDAFIDARIDAVLAGARDDAGQRHPEVRVRIRRANKGPAEALVESSAAAVMLVIGSSRRSGAPTTLGSVAHDVLINLCAPTIVVHAEEQRP